MLSKPLVDHLQARCPEAIMVRAALKHALPAEVVDRVFESNRTRQYNRKLLFSTIVQLLGIVVSRVRPSIHAAFQMFSEQIGVSVRAVYGKLNGTEPQISAGLVNASYQRLASVVDQMRVKRAALVKGYETRLIDGNHLAATEHRLAPLRKISAGPLPGVAVVVYDRERELIESVDLAEDAYCQERTLVLETVGRAEAKELWIADRNFCTSGILWQLNCVGACFVIRRHAKNVRVEESGRERRVDRTDTGVVYERPVKILDDFGNAMPARLVRVVLDNPTRDGDQEIQLLTNLPGHVSAIRVAEAYRRRWDIEVTFAEVARLFAGEIETLGHPRAALLAFCLALVAYNAVSLMKSAMRKTFGCEKVDQEVSLYYVAHKVQSSWEALELVPRPNEWEKRFSRLTPKQLGRYLCRIAKHINLLHLKKHPRGPKKPQPKRRFLKNQPHVSTARLLAQRN